MKPEELFALLPEEYDGREDFETAVNNLFEGFGAKELNLQETIEAQKAEITALKVVNYDNMMKNRGSSDDEQSEKQPKLLDIDDLFEWQ